MLDLIVALSLSAVTSFHIGNSLMNDGLGNFDPDTGTALTGTYGVEAIARGRGFDYQMAMHIDGSRTMQQIWENPEGVEFNGYRPAYGQWDNALANFHWDHVLFEPYLGDGNTLGLDKEMIGNFIDYTRSNPANSDTIFYVYEVWPRQSWNTTAGGYSEYWLYEDPTGVYDETLTKPTRAQYDHLMNWAQATYAPQGILVRTVPNGEVWHKVNLAIQSGEITEIPSMASLYRDDLHASHQIGRYLAAATNFAVMFQTDPSGMVPPSPQFNQTYPQSLYDKLNKIIWNVVSSDPHTGVADFNDDGYVSHSDLAVWQDSYGMSAGGDADGDGYTTGRDLLAWQRSFQVPAKLPKKVASYHIGNTLMTDGLGNYANGNAKTGTYGLEAMARTQGHDYRMAMHIDNSRPMRVIWENPEGVESNGYREAYGAWDVALVEHHWDHVMFEPYFGDGNTLGLDKEMIGNFIDYTCSNPENSDTIFYVYQVWPRQTWSNSAGGYENYWLADPDPDDDTLTRPRRSYYDFLMGWAQEAFAPQGILVREIPNGEVWNQVILAIQSGEITEITIDNMYRDDLHASYQVGRYLAAATNFAVMFQTNPSGMIPPSPQFSQYYPQSLYDKLNEIIWDVVSSDPHTGIADFNDDGYVSQADLALWQNAYGISAAADADGDGDTDGRDFLVWQRSFQAVTALSAFSVPEPGTALLLSAALYLCCSCRIRR